MKDIDKFYSSTQAANWIAPRRPGTNSNSRDNALNAVAGLETTPTSTAVAGLETTPTSTLTDSAKQKSLRITWSSNPKVMSLRF